MQGEYKVEILNLTEVISPISISATLEAKQTYEAQPYPTMTLYILDDDKKKTEEQKRPVVYNFPEKFVRSNDIELKQKPVEVRFKLMPIAGGEQEITPATTLP
jgi:hypothetical protein